MPYCVKCGVQINAEEPKCPLCNTPVFNPDNICEKKPEAKIFSNERATVRYLINKYINITGFCFFAVMLIVLITNLSINKTISWSKIPLCILILVWFLMVFPVKYTGKLHAMIICAVSVIVTSLFLIVIDALTIFKGWSIIVLISSVFVCFAVGLPILNKKLKVINVISLMILSAIIYLFLLDLYLGFNKWSLYTDGAIMIAWSIIILPMYLSRKYSFLGAMLLNSILVSLYLFLVMGSVQKTEMFFVLVLPLIAVFTLPPIAIYLINTFCRFTSYGLLSLCFFFSSLVALSTDKILNNYYQYHTVLFHEWALITSMCCFVIALFLFFVEKSKRLKEYLNKKLHL